MLDLGDSAVICHIIHTELKFSTMSSIQYAPPLGMFSVASRLVRNDCSSINRSPSLLDGSYWNFIVQNCPLNGSMFRVS